MQERRKRMKVPPQTPVSLAIALLLPVPALAAPAHDLLVGEANAAVDVLQGRRSAEEVFDRHFLVAVPPERLTALMRRLEANNGPFVATEDIRTEGAATVRFRLRFARAVASARLTTGPEQPSKISGFVIGPAFPIDDSPQKLAADFAALPGRSSFAVFRLGTGSPVAALAEHGADQFAVGSTFKLWVLDALAEEIAAGRLRWDEVVRLGPRSLPSGITQAWPPDAPVTVETLATLMISMSDNTATDTLMRLVGRERVAQRVRATGHSDPTRMLPFLTTAESFALKLSPPALREAYATADDAGRARILARLDAHRVIERADPAVLDHAPTAIDSIEWFASAEDIARVLDSLRRRADPRVLQILGVTPTLPAELRTRFAYAGYKGGSEVGVINLTWLLRRRSGEWLVVTASWNDPKAAVDDQRFELLAQRLVQLVAEPRDQGS
jgi:hypothetical protein